MVAIPAGNTRNARIRTAALTAVAGAATFAGHIVRQARSGGVGLAGAALVAYGLGEIYGPLLFISAGVALLAAERQARK